MPKHATIKQPSRILWHIIQFISGTAIILGILFGMFFTWAYWGVDLDSGTVTRNLESATTAKFTTISADKIAKMRMGEAPKEAVPKEGELFAYMRIPALGLDWKKPIQQGTSDRILASLGVGHYSDTAMPGQQGNSAYAGHDTPNDFGALYDLPVNTEVIIEGTNNWYTYKLTKHQIATSADLDVLASNAAGTDRGLTLTTCWPRYVAQDGGQRFIWHGEFTGWAPKSDGVPNALAQTHVQTHEKINRQLNKVSEKIGMPVTGMLACTSGIIWIVLNGFNWIINRKRAADRWKHGSWNPIVWGWRLQAGLTKWAWLSTIIRIFTLLIMTVVILFAMYRWGCPWMSDHISFLPNVPHPTL